MVTNLIPMAGVGSRFTAEGYLLPKALIPVSGMPMIIKVIRELPAADKWIFVVRQEHIVDYNIDLVIKKELPNAIIIPVEKTTEGQACTCLLAESYLDPEESLFIAACDSTFLYDKKKYAQICNENVSMIVWTFTKQSILASNPSSWGWCKLAPDKKTILDMSVKVPVSSDPFNDHAVVATFYFRKAKDFIKSTKLMIQENYRIKNEFYVDSLPIFINKLGGKSVIFDVDLYVGLGKPEDLHIYEQQEYFFLHTQKGDALWRKYFTSLAHSKGHY